MRAFAFLVVGLLSLACTASCDRKTSGREGALDAGARKARVISLSPSTTETLFAIGAGPLVVGRSRFCDTPPEVRSLPAVGGYTDPNFEVIFALSPTLIVGARGPAGPRLEARLREHGVRTYFPETESVDQIDAMFIELGRLVNREDAARALAASTRAHIDRIAKAVSGKPRPRVLLLFDVEPVVTAGPKSFPDDLLTRAGGANVVQEGVPYPVLGIERVLALDPDVILDTTAAANHSESRIRKDSPVWEKLRAVREGHVVAVTNESVLRPGPRIAEAVATIARILHPDVPLD
jgi:iron complex transport system substrate-binding protein